jgi:hypothetical protein
VHGAKEADDAVVVDFEAADPSSTKPAHLQADHPPGT